MNRTRWLRSMTVAGSLCLAELMLCVSLARADGGAIQFTRASNGYTITVFTSPVPVRVGVAELSVLVQDANFRALSPDIAVHITACSANRPDRRLSSEATAVAATNKLFRVARIGFPEPGGWIVEISVGTGPGQAIVSGEIEVAKALPKWLELGPWLGLPVIALVLFAVHRGLVRRRSFKNRLASASS